MMGKLLRLVRQGLLGIKKVKVLYVGDVNETSIAIFMDREIWMY